MISVDALLFDLDGTLIDSKRDLANAVRHLQKSYRLPLSSEKQVGTFIGDGVDKLVQRALPTLSRSQGTEAIAAFKDYYRAHCLDHTRVYPGVLAALRHFRNKKMAVVTNKPVRISSRILDALGLSDFFDVLIGGDSLKRKKPDPEPVISALKTLGANISKRAVMVGDGANDILAGRAAGICTCAIRSNIGDPKKLLISRPDVIITRMSDLMRIFE
jgi:phosphoglycolate phosphatase